MGQLRRFHTQNSVTGRWFGLTLCGQEGERARISSWLDSITWLAPLLAYTFGITPDRIEDKNARMAINLNLGGAPNLDLHTAKSGGVSDTLTPFKKVSDRGNGPYSSPFYWFRISKPPGIIYGSHCIGWYRHQGLPTRFQVFSPRHKIDGWVLTNGRPVASVPSGWPNTFNWHQGWIRHCMVEVWPLRPRPELTFRGAKYWGDSQHVSGD